ncbi:NETWORKED 3A protein [Nymphaea thermarum]|nr:NETWORKED 3A protein [Nymphaea thermarum]
MSTMMLKKPSYSWWWESHNSPRQSGWLQSALSELDDKTKTMLKLIEEDADSFAQRAEMYYRKRPELVRIVEDFYRSYRSLAERYDQLKSDMVNRAFVHSGWSLPLKNNCSTEKSSEQCESFDLDDSEVDDPEPEEEDAEINCYRNHEDCQEVIQQGIQSADDYGSRIENQIELMKLRDEVARLREENRNQEVEIAEMSERKREVIRQLCMSIEIMKEENAALRKCTKESKKWGFLELPKFKWAVPGNFFSGIFVSHTNLVAL